MAKLLISPRNGQPWVTPTTEVSDTHGLQPIPKCCYLHTRCFLSIINSFLCMLLQASETYFQELEVDGNSLNYVLYLPRRIIKLWQIDIANVGHSSESTSYMADGL